MIFKQLYNLLKNILQNIHDSCSHIWLTLYLDKTEALICHPLEIAAQNGCLNSYKYIAKKTQEYNPRLLNGTTPFHLAADCGQFQICKFLIQNNLDKNPANDYGITPLHSAAEKGHFKICKLLIETLKSRSIKPEDVISFICFLDCRSLQFLIILALVTYSLGRLG